MRAVLQIVRNKYVGANEKIIVIRISADAWGKYNATTKNMALNNASGVSGKNRNTKRRFNSVDGSDG